jgi:hypothetical protein
VQINNNISNKNRFEFPGSKAHYLPLLPFTINHMILKIKPDFQSKPKKLVNCQQQLKITANRDIDQIELDVAEIRIESISSFSTISDIGNSKANNDDDNEDIHNSNNNTLKILIFKLVMTK